jgi:YidC/Oxa1 family membrane protein insertase
MVRLLLHPLARAAVRGEKARAALAPDVQKLRKRYARDPQRLQRETLELYRRSGTSMFAGCLPMLAQMPFFTVLFRLSTADTVNGAPNDLLGHTLFGAPLGGHFWTSFSPVFFGLFAAMAVVAWFSARLQSRLATTQAPAFLKFLPYGTVAAATVVPLAAGLYLFTSTAWTVAERTLLHRSIP